MSARVLLVDMNATATFGPYPRRVSFDVTVFVGACEALRSGWHVVCNASAVDCGDVLARTPNITLSAGAPVTRQPFWLPRPLAAQPCVRFTSSLERHSFINEKAPLTATRLRSHCVTRNGSVYDDYIQTQLRLAHPHGIAPPVYEPSHTHALVMTPPLRFANAARELTQRSCLRDVARILFLGTSRERNLLQALSNALDVVASNDTRWSNATLQYRWDVQARHHARRLPLQAIEERVDALHGLRIALTFANCGPTASGALNCDVAMAGLREQAAVSPSSLTFITVASWLHLARDYNGGRRDAHAARRRAPPRPAARRCAQRRADAFHDRQRPVVVGATDGSQSRGGARCG